MRKLIDLGYAVAVLTYPESEDQYHKISPSLEILESGRSITISGQEAVLTIRDALNEALPPETWPLPKGGAS